MERRIAAAVLLIAGTLGACSDSVRRELEGHVFDVPKLNDAPDDDAPFFLPALDARDGFSFYLNPEASLPERNQIAISSKAEMCTRAAGSDAYVNSTVCAARPPTWRGRPLRKVSDGVFWTYNLPADRGQKSEVTSDSRELLRHGEWVTAGSLCRHSAVWRPRYDSSPPR